MAPRDPIGSPPRTRRSSACACALLVAAAPGAAAALDLRGYLETRSQYGTPNEDSAFNPGDRLELPEYNQRTRIRTVLSEDLWGEPGTSRVRTSAYAKLFAEHQTAPVGLPGSSPDHSSFRFDEAFADVEVGDHLYLLLGKKRLPWGVGFFLNPVDVVNPPKNLAEPAQTLEGVPMALVELTSERRSVSVAYLRDFSSDLSSGNGRVAGTIGLQLGGVETKLHGVVGPSTRSMAGATLRYPRGDLVVYAEYAGRDGSDRTYFDAEGRAFQRSGWQNAALAGVTYSFLGMSSVSVEYGFDESGYTATERDAFFRALRGALADSPSVLEELTTRTRLNVSRHYVGVALGLRRLRDDWDVEARVLASLDGFSMLALPGIEYQISDRFSARLEHLAAFGERQGEYSQLLYRNRTNGYLVVHF